MTTRNPANRSRSEALEGFRFIFVLLAVSMWGMIISNQITEMGRSLTYALNARQVVIVPHHATMGDEAPTPVSGP